MITDEKIKELEDKMRLMLGLSEKMNEEDMEDLSEEDIKSMEKRKKERVKEVQKEIRSFFLSEDFTGEKRYDEDRKEEVYHIESLDITIGSQYYSDILKAFFLTDANTLYFQRNYARGYRAILDYLKDSILWMNGIDELARDWGNSVREGNCNKDMGKRRELKEKIVQKVIEEVCRIKDKNIEDSFPTYIDLPKISIYHIKYDTVIDTLLRSVLQEESKSAYDPAKSISFVLYLRGILKERRKGEDEDRHGITGNKERSDKGKKRKASEQKAENKEKDSGKFFVALPEFSTYTDSDDSTEENVSLLDKIAYKEQIGNNRIEIKAIDNFIERREVLIGCFDYLAKIFKEPKYKVEKKKLKFFHAAFTYEVIKSTEREKINGEINEEGDTTKTFLLLEKRLIRYLTLAFVILLKGGEEEEYRKMFDIIARKIMKEGIRFDGITSHQDGDQMKKLMTEFFDGELGAYGTIRNYAEEYYNWIKEV